jgi:SAM-dependent methyltransferase
MLAMVETRKWGAAPSFGPRQWLRHKLLLKELTWRLRSGVVLDAGCGEGRMAHLVSSHGLSVVGFDESRASLEQACNTPAQIACFRGSITRMALAENSFDAVVSGDVLEHIEDDRAAVAELFRVLKPGGVAIISVPADPGKWSIDDEWSGHKRRYTGEGLRSLFVDAGFDPIDYYSWGWPMTWIYYRLFYIPMLKRRFQDGRNDQAPQGLSGSPLMGLIFKLAFLPDQLGLGVPCDWGIGFIGVFEKQGSSNIDYKKDYINYRV